MPSFSTPPTKSTGDTITAAHWNTYVVDNVKALHEVPTIKGTQLGDVSIPTATNTDLGWTTKAAIAYDTLDVYDTAKPTEVPLGATGLWLVTAYIPLEASAAGNTRSYSILLGSDYMCNIATPPPAAGIGAQHITATTLVNVTSAPTVVKLRVYQDSGSTLKVLLAPSNGGWGSISAVWLGTEGAGATFTEAPFIKPGDTVPTAAQWNTYVRDNLTAVAQPPSCRLYHNANQTIAHDTYTALAFNSERWDSHGLHSTSSNTSRITISEAGLYMFGGHVSWDYTSTNGRLLALRMNGFGGIELARCANSTNGGYNSQTICCTAYCQAGDYVELVVYQNAGANRVISYTAKYTPEFWTVKLSD